METIKLTKKKLEKKMKERDRMQMVNVYCLKHPDFHEEFEMELELMNLICHMQDGLLTDMAKKYKYLTDQSSITLIRQVNEKMETLIEKLYSIVNSYDDTEKRKKAFNDYTFMQACAVICTKILKDFMHYGLKEGLDDWRVTDMKRYMSELIPESYKKMKRERFAENVKKQYIKELKAIHDSDKGIGNDVRKLYEEMEKILIFG